MLAGIDEIFSSSLLRMSDTPIEVATKADWSELLSNQILVLVSTLVLFLCVKDFFRIGRALLYSVTHARGCKDIEHNGSLAQMRDRLALALILPLSLVLNRYSLAQPHFTANIPQLWSAPATVCVVLGYLLLRLLSHAPSYSPRFAERDDTLAAYHCPRNYFILCTLTVLAVTFALSVFGIAEPIISATIIYIIAFFYILAFLRVGLILSQFCKGLTTICYLCGLELLPTAIWVTIIMIL